MSPILGLILGQWMNASILFNEVVECYRNAPGRLRHVWCDQQFLRLLRLLCKRDPDVSKDRRVLQLATISGGSEKDVLDEAARNCYRHRLYSGDRIWEVQRLGGSPLPMLAKRGVASRVFPVDQLLLHPVDK